MEAFRARQFAKAKAEPNTFIGGIAKTGGTGVNAPIDTPWKLSQKLGIAVNRISGFKVIGDDVECRIKGSYNLPSSCFYSNKNITNYIDVDGLVNAIPTQAFMESSIEEVIMPNCKSLSRASFRGATNIVELNLPIVDWDSWQTFDMIGKSNAKLKRVIFNELTTISNGHSRQWLNTSLFEVYECKKLKNMTNEILTTVEGPNFFAGFKIGATIRTNIHLFTSDNGNPNPHLLYAKNTRNAIVEFYDDDGNYVSTL